MRSPGPRGKTRVQSRAAPVFLALLVSAGCAAATGAGGAAPVAERTRVILLHDGDTHFHDNHRAAVRAFVDSMRSVEPNVFLLSAGDFLVRHPFAWPEGAGVEGYRRRGLEMVQRMNELGYDVAVAGNHELDAHGEATREILAGARFPILAANIQDGEGGVPELAPYHVLETEEGLTLAVLGLSVINFEAPPGLEQGGFHGTVGRYHHLTEQHDALVLLNHIGVRYDLELANAFPGIAAIIGGHTHSLLPEAVHVNGVLVAHAGGHEHDRDETREMFMGVVVLEFEDGEVAATCGWVLRIGPNGVRPAGHLLRAGDAWRWERPACPTG